MVPCSECQSDFLLFFFSLYLIVDFGFNDMNTRGFETGVDYEDDTVHLADRLTHVHVKGEDHPVPFAQGVRDDTNQGMFFESTATAEQTAQTSGSSVGTDKGPSGWISHGPAWGPEEMAAEMGCSTNTAALTEQAEGPGVFIPRRRKFYARDKELKFAVREEFSGRREGFVFRLGGQGMGYYEDRPLTEADLLASEEKENETQNGI